MNEMYVRQVELLLSLLPIVMKEECFALKGGTAINFFWQNVPRLSVDIDLVYLPLNDRTAALEGIDAALMRIRQHIQKVKPSAQFREKRITGGYCITLSVISENVLVKIEPNTILRGCVYPVLEKDISSAIKEQLNISSFVTVRTLEIAELYGGKVVAALDRQHPRDLFDVKILFEQGGITDKIRTAFIIYLAGHNRPMHEVLQPRPIDIESVYHSEFSGMTRIPVTVEELAETRKKLFTMMPSILTENERTFILSLKKGEPDWSLLLVSDIDKFPAIQWKLHNIRQLDGKKHKEQMRELETVLGS